MATHAGTGALENKQAARVNRCVGRHWRAGETNDSDWTTGWQARPPPLFWKHSSRCQKNHDVFWFVVAVCWYILVLKIASVTRFDPGRYPKETFTENLKILQVKCDEDRKWRTEVWEENANGTLRLRLAGVPVLRGHDWQHLMGRFTVLDYVEERG